MPRKGPVRPRKIAKDPIYDSDLLSKLVNRLMRDGKKGAAQAQVYAALEILKEGGKSPMEVFAAALDNIRPSMEVRPRRVGGAAYQVPVPVRGPRKDSLAIRWLVAASRNRSNSEFKTFAAKLAAELTDAANGEGGAVKKRTETERAAEANKAFAHFRW